MSVSYEKIIRMTCHCEKPVVSCSTPNQLLVNLSTCARDSYITAPYFEGLQTLFIVKQARILRFKQHNGSLLTRFDH